MTTQDKRHLEGEGQASHRFNPEKAEEFREPDRLRAMKLEELVDELNMEPNDTVLDLGTGSGALLPFLSEAISGTGTVLASDISNAMLSQADQYVRSNHLTNVVLLRNEPTGIPVYDGNVDVLLIISSLHEFAEPLAMLDECARVLREDGRIGMLEWRNEETRSGPPLDHRLSEETVRQWLREAGFEQCRTRKWNDEGYDLFRATKPTTG